MNIKRAAVLFLLWTAALCASTLAQDVTPPTVTDVTPLPGAVLTSEPSSIIVTFSEAIDPATVTTDTFRLVRSGGDGTFGDGNEIEVVPVSVTLDGTGTQATMDLAGANLPDDLHRVGVFGSLGGGNALRFDGSNDFVYVQNAPELNPTAEITVEAWFVFEVGGSGNPRILSKGAEAFGDTSYEILTVGTGSTRQIRGLIREASGVSPSHFDAGEWHHVAMTYGDSVFRIYVNGELEVDVAKTAVIGSTTYPLAFGKKTATPNDPFKGCIDEVRLWNVARTQSQIRATMCSALRGDEAGLVGYWRLDEGSGQLVHDSTASGNDGTLGNNSDAATNDPTWEPSLAPLKGATDLVGNPLDGEYLGSFPSGDGTAGGDFVCTFTINAKPPYVVSTSPADGTTDVPLSSNVTVTFNEPMDAATTAAAFSIDPAVSGTPTVSGAILTLIPSGGLESDTEYTVTVSTGATDLVGLPLAADYTFTFTTTDLTAPADVTELAAHASATDIELVWRNPFDVDFAGLVIVRSVDGPPTGSPADGATYAAGNIIGNSVVLHVGTGTTGIPGSKSGWSEPGVEEGREYFYAVFTYDEKLNYSPGVSASAVAGGSSGGGDGGLCSPGSSASAVLFLLALTLAGLAVRLPGTPCRRGIAR